MADSFFMQYVAMMVGAWGAWVVLRVIASEREARMRVMREELGEQPMTVGSQVAK